MNQETKASEAIHEATAGCSGQQRVFTLAEMAKLLKLSKKTLYRYANAGLIGIKIGGQYRFRDDELDRILRTGLPPLKEVVSNRKTGLVILKQQTNRRERRAWDRQE